MKTILTRYKLEIAGMIAGAIVGWSYWFYVGCASGSCPITSSPTISTIYGAFLGMTAFSIFKKENKTQHNN
jgi:hypothetical protein